MLRNLSALKYAAAAAVLAVGFTVAMLIRQALLYPEHGDCIDECGRPGWCDANATDVRRDRRVRGAAVGRLRLPGAAAHRVRAAVPHPVGALLVGVAALNLQGDAATRKIGLGAVVLVLVLYIHTLGIAGFARFGGDAGRHPQQLRAPPTASPTSRACIAITALSPFPSQHFPARVALWRWYKELCGCRRRRPARDRDSGLNTGDVGVAEHDDAQRPAVERRRDPR